MSITATTTPQTPVVSPERPTSKALGLFVWSGAALALAVVFLFYAQIAWARLLVTPWYLPIGGTVGALMVLFALTKRRTWVRIGVLIPCVLLACLEWLFLLVMTVLPAYGGPIKPGMPMPAFHARLVAGSEIDETWFRQNPMTVVVFYQGRWCPFCTTQLSDLETHHAEFARLNAKVMVVSMEAPASEAQTQRDCPHLVVVSDEKRELSNALEIINRGFKPDGGDCDIPTILLVDQSGIVRWLHRPTRFIARPSASELAAIVESQMSPAGTRVTN